MIEDQNAFERRGTYGSAPAYFGLGGPRYPDPKSHGSRKKRILIIALVLLVLLAAAAAAFFVLKPGEPVIDSAAAEYAIPGYDNPDGVERGRIRIPTYSTWDMQAGTSLVEVPLINTEGNPCYMQFTVKLKDGGEVLYQSDLVPPGQAIPNIHLNRTLDAGTYPVTVSIGTFSLDDPSQPLNGAELGTNIVAS